jgi:hypothetical protein
MVKTPKLKLREIEERLRKREKESRKKERLSKDKDRNNKRLREKRSSSNASRLREHLQSLI